MEYAFLTPQGLRDMSRTPTCAGARFQYPDFNGIERSTCPRRALYVNLTGGLLSFWLARLPSALGGSRFCALLTGYCQIDANGCVSVDFQARPSQKLLSIGCENGREEVRMRA